MQSMTGCGRCQLTLDGREITLELRSVNHRFLDLSLRLPRELSFLEETVRRDLQATLKRGHVDVFLAYRNLRQDARTVTVDEGLLKAYVEAARHMQALTGDESTLTVKDLMALPDVVQVNAAPEDKEAVTALCRSALAQALDELCAMRRREGEALRADLTQHLDALSALRDQIETRAPQVAQSYRERLAARLSQLDTDPVEPQRLAQEVALFADKCAIDEELSRLQSHVAQMRQCLAADAEVGRRLDFLTQEMNREANTIGSKASDGEITSRVLLAKAEIEKLREQVQNVE